MQDLTGKTASELTDIAVELGEAPYRGKQIAKWIYRSFVTDIEEMTDLPVAFRARLAEQYRVAASTIAHRDSAPDRTIKYLIRLEDGEQVESVYLPYAERVSVCVSSQVGCAAGCTFCATSQGGLARNMTSGEIVGQVLTLARENPKRRISHAVYMGMGEPLMNYDEVVKSVRMLNEEVGMSARHLTISTVGVVPGILRLAEEELSVTLALSLHAPNDEVRERLIPTARKWKLAEILDACRIYRDRTGRNLTFEYLMIADINDSELDARMLAKVLGRLPGNVNLIPFNYVQTDEGFRRPDAEKITRFREVLEERGRITTQRMERGHAISAACGQLKRLQGTLRPSRVFATLTPVE